MTAVAQVMAETPAVGSGEALPRQEEVETGFAEYLALILAALPGLGALTDPGATGLQDPLQNQRPTLVPAAEARGQIATGPGGWFVPAEGQAAGASGEEAVVAIMASEAGGAQPVELGDGPVELVAGTRPAGSTSGELPVAAAPEAGTGAGRVPAVELGPQTEGRNPQNPEGPLTPGPGSGLRDPEAARVHRPEILGTRGLDGVNAQAPVKEAGGGEVSVPTGGAEAAGGREASAPSGGAEAAGPEALLARELVERGLAVWQHGYGYVRLKLKPEFLGQVELHVSSRLGRLAAQVVVESEVVRNLVQASFSHLRDQLAQYGLSLERLSVEVGGYGSGNAQAQGREPGYYGRPGPTFGWGGADPQPKEAVHFLVNCLA